MTNKTTNKTQLPEFLKLDGKIITDKIDIANQLNTFFTNIGLSLASKITTDGNKTYKSFLNEPIYSAHELTFNKITEVDVLNIIDKLPSKASSGVDGISPILLKHIKNEICRPVTLILNQCLTNGIIPDKLKNAKVVPMHKSDDETMFNNYRPISILPTTKVFEKVIFNEVHEYFHVISLYFINQYGFRKKHSTELAVLEVIDRITNKLDQGITPINIYLDLSKAFDTLDMNKLSLNVKKTEAMLFYMPQKKIIVPKIKINGTIIEFVDNFNFLGINLNKHLNWNPHVKIVSNKLLKTVGILNILKKTLPLNILRIIYNALILPQLNYGILAWGHHAQRLNLIQKRAVRN